MEKKKQMRTVAIIVVAVVVVVAVIFGVYWLNRSGTDKTITLEVITDEGTTSHKISTDAEYLGEVLNAEGLISGEESRYGILVRTVDGITADDSQWWSLTKGGEDIQTGLDMTPIKNGDKFEYTLTSA